MSLYFTALHLTTCMLVYDWLKFVWNLYFTRFYLRFWFPNLTLGSTKQINVFNKTYIIRFISFLKTRVHFEILLSAFRPHMPAPHAWLMPDLGFAEEHKCVTSPLNTINVVEMKCAQAVIYHCLTRQRCTQWWNWLRPWTFIMEGRE